MTTLIMLCVILLMLCVLPTQSIDNRGVVEINPPRLIPDIHKIQVHSDDTFQLVCECDQPIHWSYPKLRNEAGDEYASLVSITHSVTNGKTYHSVLKMTNAYYLDTGYYYCIVNGTKNLEGALENVTQIYIFIKDEKNLLATDEMFTVLEANQYDTVIIPCQPTSLEVNVTLSKNSEVIPIGAWKEGAVNVTFDPTAGFYLNPISTADSGVYECVATLEEESIARFYQINVLKTPKILNSSGIEPNIGRPTAEPTTNSTCNYERVQETHKKQKLDEEESEIEGMKKEKLAQELEYLKLKNRKMALEIMELETRLGLRQSEITSKYYRLG